MSRHIVMLFAAFVIAGCASRVVVNDTFTQGRALVESGHVEQGLAMVQEASRQQPDSQEIRTYYYRQRDNAVHRYVALGDKARALGMLEDADEAYKQTLILDPENARAKAGRAIAASEMRLRGMVTEAQSLERKGDPNGALARAREVLAINAGHRDAQALVRRLEELGAKAASDAPQLDSALRQPITLEFRDASVRSVFELLSKTTGLNFIFDKDVQPDLRTTVFVRNTSIEDVIRFVLVTNQLDRKVLNDRTLLIYPNTPAKARDYKDLVVRSFYLANADARQTANMIKTVVKTRDMYVDEKTNMVVIRDTPEAVRLAERLVANQDLAEPEVMLEVEIMEVGTTVLNQLGIQWPTQLSFGLMGAAGVAGSLMLPEWINRSANLVRLTVSDPLLSINLRKQDGRTNILANPRIRVKNKDKAKIHIGDKVPVITSTATATGFISESVNYLDVGLKLEVEPTVFLEEEVGIKIGLEVSSIAREIRSPSGTLTYQVGTRNASTNLRLRDGETQVLAGLINDEDRRSANKVPGLGDLPVAGRLFSATNDTANKTEIVLLITPRIVRNLKRPETRHEEFRSGTDADIGAPPLLLQSMPRAAGEGPSFSISTPRTPFAAPQGAGAAPGRVPAQPSGNALPPLSNEMPASRGPVAPDGPGAPAPPQGPPAAPGTSSAPPSPGTSSPFISPASPSNISSPGAGPAPAGPSRAQ